MRALVLVGPNDFSVVEVDRPTLQEGTVLVQVKACGLCGTDLHIVDGEYPPTPFPITPGHESAGEIVEVAPDIRHLAIGDRVGIDASLSCGHCLLCRQGNTNVCPERGGIGGTVNGGFAQFALVPAENCYPIAPHLSFSEAALAEPLSCVLHGIQLLRPEFQPSVLVIGAGTMGLLSLQTMKASGAKRVDLANRSHGKLQMAVELGADRTMTLDELGLKGEYDIVIEATGAPEVIALALASLQPRGQLLLLGVSPADQKVEISPFDLYKDEISILASMGAKNTYAQALQLIAAGTIRVTPLLTHSFGLEGFAEAIAIVRSGVGIKVQILPN